MPISQKAKARTRLCTLLAMTGPSVFAAHAAHAEPARFNPAFLYQGSAGQAALAALEQHTTLAPGAHTVRVSLNLQDHGAHELEFSQAADGQLQPCLPAQWLASLGLRLSTLQDPALAHAACLDLPQAIADASVVLDSQAMSLAISIPQIAMQSQASGQVAPSRWDEGINAAFVNYQVSAQRSASASAHQSSEDAVFNAGANLGAWRLRSGYSMRSDQQGRRWQRNYTYAQRDVPGLNANLTVGESNTGGDVFTSQPILGAVLASDFAMLSDNQQAYAPVIRGVALSRAKIDVRQNGYTVYTGYVSAGAFELDDLAVYGNGELEVTLTEADGQVRRFTQPYASLGNLLREGVWRYEASVGRYAPARAELDRPMLAQASLARGLGWKSTAYGGLRQASFYRAATLGAARDLGTLGALSADITVSESQPQTGPARRGESYAIRYGKHFASRTYLRFAGYRYSTEGYRDFGEAVYEHSRNVAFLGNRRSRFELSMSQPIGRNTSSSLTLSQEDYWGSQPSRRQVQFNISTYWRKVQYSAYATQSVAQAPGYEWDSRQIGLSVSMPLEFGNWSSASFDAVSSQGNWSQRASLSTADTERGLNYSASVARSTEGHNSLGASVAYQGQNGSYSLGYNAGPGYQNLNGSAAGSLLLHEDGFLLSPMAGDTMALVHVPGIEGVTVQNAGRQRTSADGYSLVPYMRPYRSNSVTLDTHELGPEVELDNGTVQVVPRRGAIVRAKFAARKVNRLILRLLAADGRPLPFGAQVTDANGAVLGMVGQGGQLLLATSLEPQVLHVTLDEGRCGVELAPQLWPEENGFRQRTLTCL
ncbi:fimbria/pilus outer membrane usher protein [Pseudomonas sp. KNUC1026]|uniref:fimbria/pilus outer membrane usher protein n=1 Tax=Pseudomonas sp. KNUC1026 TaxID=2893890 RepID=UPI001F44EBD1|nr:fimbria/pilus outer membrane usher protein [Pseudomonas sp. KNUC1026]UFH48289.1 fimbrial biogenesis outer membrane usher protein [Pseudomonas sp. KNUC1026]